MKDSKEIKDEELEKVSGGYSNGNDSYPCSINDCYMSPGGGKIYVITSTMVDYDVYLKDSSTGEFNREYSERAREENFIINVISGNYTYIGKKDSCGYVLNY